MVVTFCVLTLSRSVISQMCWQLLCLYRAEKKSLQILLSRTQAGPGRKVKQEQEETSRNHVPRLFLGSVYDFGRWVTTCSSSTVHFFNLKIFQWVMQYAVMSWVFPATSQWSQLKDSVPAARAQSKRDDMNGARHCPDLLRPGGSRPRCHALHAACIHA